MPEESRFLPEKPALKDIAYWGFCVVLFVVLIIVAFSKDYPITWQMFVTRAQTEVEYANRGHEFTLASSARTFRSGYALFESTDGGALYVVAFAEKAPFAGQYSENIFVMDADSGDNSELREMGVNGQLSLLDETVTTFYGDGLVMIFLCLLFLVVSMVSLVIVHIRYRAERSVKSNDA